MIITGQTQACRTLSGLDQRTLAEPLGVSPSAIRWMDGSDGAIRRNLDLLMKRVGMRFPAGIDMIGEGTPDMASARGVRLIGQMSTNQHQ